MQNNIKLFKSLFLGRQDVIPKHWETKNNQGYTPICKNEWNKDLCSKPCHSCENQAYIPLSDDLLQAHFSGAYNGKLFLMGCYPLFDGNLCNFIAGDFDNHDGKRNPLDDIQAMAEVCEIQEMPFHACLSKSGKGYHGYWFFDNPVESWKARAVYFACLEEADIISDGIQINSFDRLFPNQDKLSGRGLGNLIALPLHRINLGTPNQPSRFLTPESDYRTEYKNQWKALQFFNDNRIPGQQIDDLIQEWELKPVKKKISPKIGNKEDFEKLNINDIIKGNIPKGHRDELIFKYACRLREKGLTQQEAELMCCNLVDNCEQSQDDKYTHAEAITKVQSAWKYEPSQKTVPPQMPKNSTLDLAELPYSDVERTKELLKQHCENIRFSHTQNCWLIWNSKYWERDFKGKIKQIATKKASEIATGFKVLAAGEEKEKKKAAHAKMAVSSESRAAIDNMINLAQSGDNIPIDINDLDTDKWLLNCENGMIDLKTCELIPYEKNKLISKIAPVKYNPNAKSELWENFLNTIMPNKEKQAFLQRFLGYCLTADTTEQKFVIATGAGSNGKSVINQVFSYILGDYAAVADSKSFAEQRVDAIREDLAVLKGARFVSTSEPKEKIRLDTSKVKSLTGDHAITCRFLHQNSFTYIPEFKIFFLCNHMPIITAQDHGTWRRICVLKFDVTIPENEQDRHLPDKLINDHAEAILNYAIEGLKQFHIEGLKPPEIVQAATMEYKANSDKLGDFLNECCNQSDFAKIERNELFKYYQNYINYAGEKGYGRNQFNQILRERGFDEYRDSKSKRYWIGLEIIHFDY